MKKLLMLFMFMWSPFDSKLASANSAGPEGCRACTLPIVTWSTVSSGEYSEYSSELRNASLQGQNNPLDPYNEDEILNGTKNLLSIGEGAATYIKTLLENNKSKNYPATHIHAVDLIYSDPYRNILDFSVARFIAEHPNNYHFFTFQEFALVSTGASLEFDEIIARYSLSHMLDKQPELLEHIVRNLLKEGGYIRIWPTYGELYVALNTHIERMFKEGLIANYSVNRGNMLIIQKKRYKGSSKDSCSNIF